MISSAFYFFVRAWASHLAGKILNRLSAWKRCVFNLVSRRYPRKLRGFFNRAGFAPFVRQKKMPRPLLGAEPRPGTGTAPLPSSPPVLCAQPNCSHIYRLSVKSIFRWKNARVNGVCKAVYFYSI